MTFTSPAAAPKAEIRPTSDTRHGITRADDYAWLRDPNWQEVMRDPSVLQPDIRAYLDAENAYAEATLAPLSALRATLFDEMKGRIKQDDSSVPMPDGPFDYFVRFETGAEHPLICRRRTGDPKTGQTLLDANSEAGTRNYFKLGDIAHSPDHRFLAWPADTKGSEYFTIRIRDLDTGADLADLLCDTAGQAVWALDGKTLFYIARDKNHRPSKVYRHHLGTGQMMDILVYEEMDPGFYVGIGLTQSGRYVVIDAHDHQTNELHLIDANDPEAAPRLVEPRSPGIKYALEHVSGHGAARFFVLTNRGEAEDFKIMETPVETLQAAHWRDVIAHRPGVLILDQVTFRDHHIRLERAEGLKRIIVRRLADGMEHEISFDEDVYELDLSPGYEYDTRRLFFTYSSMTTPRRVFEYDLETRTRVLRKEQEIPSGHTPDDYVTQRVFATAPDGEQIPISLFHHQKTPLDGTAPLLLYGYGAYGISMPPSFSLTALSLVDRGFVYAIAHIRGGKERGYRWYRGGKLFNKKNSFTDFIAAATYLAGGRYTSRGRIVAQGGSAGGLLMGAVANMAPELFKAIIAEVPFVDVLNTMLDETLPLTPPEWLEWGNPIKDADAYAYITSYCPYENVRAQDYPHILALSGLTDPRVTYWEPAKWIARLRATKTGDGLVLLRTNMSAGHGGAAGRFARLDEVALAFAFALTAVGRVALMAKAG